jgi:hypothetical protein
MFFCDAETADPSASQSVNINEARVTLCSGLFREVSLFFFPPSFSEAAVTIGGLASRLG